MILRAMDEYEFDTQKKETWLTYNTTNIESFKTINFIMLFHFLYLLLANNTEPNQLKWCNLKISNTSKKILHH